MDTLINPRDIYGLRIWETRSEPKGNCSKRYNQVYKFEDRFYLSIRNKQQGNCLNDCVRYFMKYEKLVPKIPIKELETGTLTDALNYYNFHVEQIEEDKTIIILNEGESDYSLTLFRDHWYVKLTNECKIKYNQLEEFIFKKEKNAKKGTISRPKKEFQKIAYYDVETVYDKYTHEF